jgi:hypothetical protein
MICSTENLLGYSIIDEQQGSGPETGLGGNWIFFGRTGLGVFERFEMR